MVDTIEIDFQVFTGDGGEVVGSVRAIDRIRHTILVYIENAGDFMLPASSIRAVHAGKLILDSGKLTREVKQAIAQAHKGEIASL